MPRLRHVTSRSASPPRQVVNSIPFAPAHPCPTSCSRPARGLCRSRLHDDYTPRPHESMRRPFPGAGRPFPSCSEGLESGEPKPPPLEVQPSNSIAPPLAPSGLTAPTPATRVHDCTCCPGPHLLLALASATCAHTCCPRSRSFPAPLRCLRPVAHLPTVRPSLLGTTLFRPLRPTLLYATTHRAPRPAS